MIKRVVNDDEEEDEKIYDSNALVWDEYTLVPSEEPTLPSKQNSDDKHIGDMTQGEFVSQFGTV